MDHWIKYGLIAALIIGIGDLFRKRMVNNIEPYLVVLIPLIIAGFISFIILMNNGSKNDIKNLDKTSGCVLLLLGLLIPMSQYFIAKSLKDIHNPGYAKTIVSLNVLISTVLSIFIFKNCDINRYTTCGILLVLVGTYLITKKA